MTSPATTSGSTPPLAERFAKLYAGVVYDALCFDLKLRTPVVLRADIKPAWQFPGVLFGPAFTCQGEKILQPEQIDDLVRIEMLKQLYLGCVQVIASGGFCEVAQFGDISGKLARKFGAVGAVLDAPTRDIRIIEADRFPIFACGVQPTDAYGKWQIRRFQVPITMPGIEGNVTIAPGDFIFGDRDGVIVIPAPHVRQVLECAEARLHREDNIRRELQRENDPVQLYQKIGRW